MCLWAGDRVQACRLQNITAQEITIGETGQEPATERKPNAEFQPQTSLRTGHILLSPIVTYEPGTGVLLTVTA